MEMVDQTGKGGGINISENVGHKVLVYFTAPGSVTRQNGMVEREEGKGGMEERKGGRGKEGWDQSLYTSLGSTVFAQ